MKAKIGIIGSPETVDRIRIVSSEYENKVGFSFFCYTEKEESLEIVQQNQNQLDVILFAGQAPYFYVKQFDIFSKPALYIPSKGTSIYEALWKIRDKSLDYTKMSIDTVDEKSATEILDSLNIPKDNIFIRYFAGNIDTSELYDFHYNLWNAGKIKVVVTGISRVANKLQERGIPVFKLYPTASLIREHLNNAISIANIQNIKNTQVAIQIIRIEDISNTFTKYNFSKIKNQLESKLIDYTKENYGSFFATDKNEYTIFATRGALSINNLKHKFPYIIMDINNRSRVRIFSGVGYGNTVHEAESKARIALKHASSESNSSCYIVDEFGIITGPINSNKQLLSYNLIVIDRKTEELAAKAKVSSSYIYKIKSVIKSANKDTFDSKELSEHLGISVRSARRILNNLEKTGHATVIGKASQGVGRPRKIFRLSL